MVRRLLFLIVACLFGIVALGSNRPLAVLAQTPAPEPRPPPVWDGTLRRIRVPILMYHYVSNLPADADQYRVDLTIIPELFRAHLAYLRDQGYSTISLYQLDEALTQGTPLPPKPVILTFDDGYIDHYLAAFPLLQEYGFTGTFFIITGLADANRPDYANWHQIREMAAAGMDMESHTKDHADLRARDYDFLIYQLLGSLESLSAYTGHTTHMLSYPIGHYDDLTLSVVSQLPIWRAVTTDRGVFQTTDNRLEMPRVRIAGNTSVAGLASLLAANQ
jgi:peptidoglycan/xylan/chitin deacetylase (PgdA/CDA1 family)